MSDYIKTTLRESLNQMGSDDDIRNAKVCPYCGGEPKLVDSEIVYNKSYGPIYLCQPCWAWVGVHDGTTQPLGRLANNELRTAKKRAHYYFDPLWKKAMEQRGMSKTKARKAAYTWLSKTMNIPFEYTHIGMFDVKECEEVVRLCLPYHK